MSEPKTYKIDLCDCHAEAIKEYIEEHEHHGGDGWSEEQLETLSLFIQDMKLFCSNWHKE
jgi:hypothetical protein